MSDSRQVVCVVGLGYIGLPTAAFFAYAGLKVIGVDVNANTVETVNNGEVPFVEPGFSDMLRRVVQNGSLRATAETPEADAYIVSVPTPFRENHAVDDSYIMAAADGIAPKLSGGELVVLESTSPAGLTRRMAERILAARPDLTTEEGKDNTVHFAHCPERVLPGKIMAEMSANDRIIGGLTPAAARDARDLYATFCDGELLTTTAETAEMAKLTENSFRDVNIAFANELSLICDELGVNVWELIELANHHPRVNILQPGPGVGGHCIAVDPWFIVSSAPEQARLIRTAREVNDAKPDSVVAKVADAVANLESPTIAALGLAFKPDIDDLRESPALDITGRLAERHTDCKILAVEPNIDELPAGLAGHSNVELTGLEEALEAAEIVVLLVDHREFKEITLGQIEGKAVIDTRGMFEKLG